MLIVETPEGCDTERRYILDVMLGRFLGLTYQHRSVARRDVEIRSADSEDVKVLRMNDTFFQSAQAQWLRVESLPQGPLPRMPTPGPIRALLPESLPVLYGDAEPNSELVRESDDRVSISIDIFGGAFMMLSRYEEIANPIAESVHAWFSAKASLAAREGLLNRPIVNEYLELLWYAMHHLWPWLRRKERMFRILPSHDVDWPSCNVGRGVAGLVKTMAGDLLVRKSPATLARRVRSAPFVITGSRTHDVCNTFDFIMDASEKRHLSSCFNFIAGHSAGMIDGLYDIADPWICTLLTAIHARGHEIGLHPSYNSFRDSERIQSEFASLLAVCDSHGIEQATWGGRQHYLRWRSGETWQHWEKAGLGYDSTLGHAERLGFRCGVCYEYPAYDLVARRAMRLIERPLVAMEVTALDIMGLTLSEAAARIIELAATCRRYNGDFTLLWHNNRLVTSAERSTYLTILDAAGLA
jgi:hypothetical protein